MKICMVGWYFNPDLIKLMEKVSERHKVDVVAHRDGEHGSLDMLLVDNIGLEFHCYDTYIKRLWDGESDVLFLHDDLEVHPVMVNYEIIPPTNIFNRLAKLDIDQGYIFQNEDDAGWNAYKDGRLILISGRLIKHLRESGGLWFDVHNTGQTTTGPYNAGIVEFHNRMNHLHKQFNICNIIYCPAIKTLRRNGEVEHSINARV